MACHGSQMLMMLTSCRQLTEADPPLGLGAETARKENGDISTGADTSLFTVPGIHSIGTADAHNWFPLLRLPEDTFGDLKSPIRKMSNSIVFIEKWHSPSLLVQTVLSFNCFHPSQDDWIELCALETSALCVTLNLSSSIQIKFSTENKHFNASRLTLC